MDSRMLRVAAILAVLMGSGCSGGMEEEASPSRAGHSSRRTSRRARRSPSPPETANDDKAAGQVA